MDALESELSRTPDDGHICYCSTCVVPVYGICVVQVYVTYIGIALVSSNQSEPKLINKPRLTIF